MMLIWWVTQRNLLLVTVIGPEKGNLGEQQHQKYSLKYIHNRIVRNAVLLPIVVVVVVVLLLLLL